MDDLKQLKEQYKEELLNNVLPFLDSTFPR